MSFISYENLEINSNYGARSEIFRRGGWISCSFITCTNSGTRDREDNLLLDCKSSVNGWFHTRVLIGYLVERTR